MSNLRTNLTSGMNYLRRRFSSDDLLKEGRDEEEANRQPFSSPKMSFSKKILPSAPSFPSFASVQGVTRGFLAQASHAGGFLSSADSPGGSHTFTKLSYNKNRCKTILIIDDRHTDWPKYFAGKKAFGDWDLRVEQAEFSELNLASYTNEGSIVEIVNSRNSNQKTTQSFQPDIVLVRQHARNANENWRNIVLGLHYGGVESVNSLEAVYNFLDKPWVFSHLVRIQKKLGRDAFPLIDQTYYPNHREMVSNLWLVIPKFPVVVKIGHAFSGMGKVKVDNHYAFQDIASVMAVTNCYSTMEPHVDSQGDIYVQKIGPHYKAYMRKAMSGNWKANVGSAILEEIQVTDRYRLWVDECSTLFGGLDMLSIKAIKSLDGREYIIEVNDSSMPLLGNSQDADCRAIADLILHKLEAMGNKDSKLPFNQPMHGLQQPNNQQQQTQLQPLQQQQQLHQPQQLSFEQVSLPSAAVNHRNPPQRSFSFASVGNMFNFSTGSEPTPPDSQLNITTDVAFTRPSGPASPGTIEAIARDLEEGGGFADDTMNNLRKTFAGIFGNIQ